MDDSPLSPPQELNENGKLIWNKSMAIYSDLFPELLEKGLLKEKGDLPNKYVNLIKNTDALLNTFKEIHHIFSKKGRSKEFIEHNKKYEFSELGIVYLWATNIIFNILNSAEMIRNTFLNVLTHNEYFYPNMGLGLLLENLKIHTTNGGKLQKMVDSTLRNALTHRTYYIDLPDLIYFRSMRLDKEKRMKLNKLTEKVYEYNIISKALIEYVAHLGDILFI